MWLLRGVVGRLLLVGRPQLSGGDAIRHATPSDRMDAIKRGVDGDAIRQDGSGPQACSIRSGALDGALEVQPNGRERAELSCTADQSAAA